ncbi:MAG: class I SAM-dependent methyltransferase [Chloroflexota bacterium]
MSAAGAATGAAPARSAPPDRPPGGPERSRWAFGQEVAAEAWGPELGTLLDRLDLHDGDRVLDAGCGAGRLTRMLAERVRPSGEVLAIDADPEAVAWAAWRLRDLAGTGASIELRDGWVEHLPWPDAALDGAWCSAVLGYLADPVEAMRELVRVVRPGGRIILLTGDAARATFLPIPPDLEARLRAAERTIAGAGFRP